MARWRSFVFGKGALFLKSIPVIFGLYILLWEENILLGVLILILWLSVILEWQIDLKRLLVLLFGITLGVFIWLFHYQIVMHGDQAYKLDRWTGNVYLIKGKASHPVVDHFE